MHDLIYIRCTFADSDNLYTYITNDKTIKPGDYVLVESNKPTNRILHTIENREGRPLNVLSVLLVEGFDESPKDDIIYKPIVQKIDFRNYLKLKGEL